MRFNRCSMSHSLDLTRQRNVSKTRRWILQRTNNICQGSNQHFLRGTHTPNAPAFPSPEINKCPQIWRYCMLKRFYCILLKCVKKWFVKFFVAFLGFIDWRNSIALLIKKSKCVNPNKKKKPSGLVKSPKSFNESRYHSSFDRKTLQ